MRPLSLLNDNEVAKAALVIKKNLISRRIRMKPNTLKKLLLSEIHSISQRSNEFVVESGKHFIRKRKLPFDTLIKIIIGMESKSLTNELLDVFDSEPDPEVGCRILDVRRHIVGGANRTLFSLDLPPRLCRTGT